MTSLGFGSCGSSASGTTSGGTLAQLIAIGAADSHLTANPEVTFWRARVQKCTNFAYESVCQTYSGALGYGAEASCTINRTGDLIYWMYVLIDIPGIVGVPKASSNNLFQGGRFKQGQQFPWNTDEDPHCDETQDLEEDDPFGDDTDDEFEGFVDDDYCLKTGLRKPYANWVNEIGHAIIQRVCFSIGGQVIDTLHSHYMHMWEELTGQPGKRLEEMIGKRYTRAQLVHDSSRDRKLYVPLPFYFTQHSGNALPLVSLQFHSVQIHVKFSPLCELVQVSHKEVDVYKLQQNTGEISSMLMDNDIKAMLDTTYIYLDMEERDRFALGSFQQLITQVQRSFMLGKDTTKTHQLNFNHPCIEILWAVQRNRMIGHNNTFDYSGQGHTDPMIRATLKVNNLTRFDREATFFRLKVPYEVHTNIPRNFIYCYSFALKPEDCQPSGSLNFSRIDNVEFSIDVAQNVADTGFHVIMFARNFNILRLKEGLGGLLFSN